MMTPFDIEPIVENIRRHRKSNEKLASLMTMQLFIHVLVEISGDCLDARSLAIAALEALEPSEKS